MYPIDTSDKLFRDGNGTSELGTVLPAWWLNQVQAELIGILEAAKLSPEKNNQNQVRRAIEKLIGDEVGKIQEANNQADGGNVKTTGNQNVNGMKTFLAEFNAAKGLSVSDTKALLDGGNVLNLGANADGGYLFNKKSGKELRLANNGSLLYDGSDIITARKVSHNPDDYTVATVPSSFALNKAFDNSIKRGGAIGLGGTAHQIAIGWDTPGLVAKVDTQTFNVGVPTGAIAYFAHTTVPYGWLKANGAAVSRTIYANLFTLIGTTYGAGDGRTTFNLPDLRGEFIRSWDDGRGIDPGRGHASQQSGNVASHRHATGWRHGDRGNEFSLILGGWTGSSNVTADVASGQAAQNFGHDEPYNHVDGVTYQNSSDHYATSREMYDQQGETRPRNIALMACIKA